MTIHNHYYFPSGSLDEIKTQLNQIIMNQQEIAAEITAIKEQNLKALGEIRGRFDVLNERITTLEAAVAAGGTASPEVLAALAEAKAAAQELDDIVPDAPSEPETPAVTS